MTEEIIIAVITGIISSAGTIAALKVDITWLKHTIIRLENRIDNHAARISNLELNFNHVRKGDKQ